MTTAPPPGSMPDLIALEEFFADPEFAVPTISPDGTRLAYLAPAHGRRNVWLRGIDETHDDAVCVTHDTRRGITTYYWAEDPRWLLYLQDTDGNEDWHLFRVDRGELDGAVLGQRGVEGRSAGAVEQDAAGRVVLLPVQGRLAGGDVDPEHVEEQRSLVHPGEHGAR